MSCVSQTMKTLQPFGDVPQKLTEQLRRSFVATRTFSQALMKGKQIIQRIVKVDMIIQFRKISLKFIFVTVSKYSLIKRKT